MKFATRLAAAIAGVIIGTALALWAAGFAQ
jgi:hypothetical protein